MQYFSERRRKFIIFLPLLFILIIIYSPLANVWEVLAATGINGRVFQDFTGNGNYDSSGGTAASPTAIDVGISGVTVTIYDVNGASAGTATTASDGTYTISAVKNVNYRIEFTNLPAGYFPSARNTDSVNGGTTSNSGSTVRFVNSGNTNDVNLALNRPEEYCQNNPMLVAARFAEGAQNGVYGSNAVLVDYPFDAGTIYTDTVISNYDDPTAHSLNIKANQIGTTFGMSYSRLSNTLVVSSYFKKHAGFGPGADGIFNTADDAGAVYLINPSTNMVTGAFTVPGATTNSHDVTNYGDDNGNIGWDAVGKTSLGGMALADDESRLFVMNLENRTLYSFSPTQPMMSQAVPTPTGASACPASDVRPFALKYYRQNLYVGMVCSAESTQTAANLRAYVYRVNPTTLAFDSAPLFTASLNYNRGLANDGVDGSGNATNPAEWRPWRNTISNNFSYPQPMLTDIEFDEGNLILGIRDRVGDQAFDNGPDAKRIAGETLRACGASGSWTLESNGRCGGSGNAPQNTGQGPGNSPGNNTGSGEFYYQDDFSNPANGGNYHDEVSLGGLLQLPGYSQVVSTIFDPISRTIDSGATFDGGVRWFNNSTGASDRAYRIYNGNGGAGVPDFGKANGIGDVLAMCNAAPIELGNRIWRDTDNNGVQDAGEAGISGITVRLFNAANTLIATAVTDANGEYYFVSGSAVDPNLTDNTGIVNGQISPNTAYQIRLDNAGNFSSGGALNNLLLTTRDQSSQSGFDDGTDSDAALAVNPAGSSSGTFPVINVITGNSGNNTHNLDFGFASSSLFSLGNRVWFDTNNDGQINAGEQGISGVSVSLFLDANGDGIPDTPGTPLATMNTDVNGYYRFDNLSANKYVVRINPTNFANAGVLAGYKNTSVSSGAELDSSLLAGENGENGINPSGAANALQTNGILSNSITLGAPGEPTGEADVQASGQGAIDAAANMTIDFGFYKLNLSGTVWNDSGAGTNNNNGILNSGENGISSIRVQIYSSTGTEILVGPDGILGTSDDATGGMFTNSSGNYNFQGLAPGQYRIVVSPNGATSSTPTSNTPDNNIDNDDNGFPDNTGNFAGKTISGLVTLTPGIAGALNNNVVSNATALTQNPTLDFGFVLSPSAVKLENFDVFTDGNIVLLSWSTGSESNNLGFNVYREFGGERQLLNAAPIAGSALRSSVDLRASGENYIWTDKEAKPGAVYYLEDIDLDGSTNLYGAVSPTFKSSLEGRQSDAKSLSDLTNIKNSSAESEVIGEKVGNITGFGNAVRKSSILESRQFWIANQPGVKISINHDGWYRISASQLEAANFDLNSNRDFWQLYADGQEIPFKLNADGSIEFFGRGLDTPTADTQIYYLIRGQAAGLRVRQEKCGDAGETAGARSFNVTVERKERTIYSSGILNGEADNWFGAVVARSNQTLQELTVRNLDVAGKASLKVKLQGLSILEHSVSIKFNDLELGTVNYSGTENKQFDFELPASTLRNGVNRVVLQSVGATSDVSLIDAVSLTYARFYEADDNELRFSVPAGQSVRVGGFTEENFSVFEIKDGKPVRQLIESEEKLPSSYGFSLEPVASNREFIAVGERRIEAASNVEYNVPSDWNASKNSANFVIITSNSLRESAANLASLRAKQGFKTEIVSVEDLYDEFSFGERNPEAIRKFLEKATTAWKTKPQFALLFGDSSYDPRNRLQLPFSRDVVPTKSVDTEYLETASDGWFADFNNDGIEDIAIGRLPVATKTEADVVIEKLARYDNQAARGEKSNVLVADSGFENYSASLQNILPVNVSSPRIDRAGMTGSQMHEAILSQINASPTVVTFTGHGSTVVWSDNTVFQANDAASLNNKNLSVFILMTCLNGYTHNSSTNSMAEALIKSENGAVAVWASSGMTHSSSQFEINQAATSLIFNDKINRLRIGDIVRTAKQASADADVRRTWQLIGDPTIFIR